MTREEALEALTSKDVNNPAIMLEALDMAIKALKQEPNIKALGEDMRICQESITDEKVIIGFNMAVALCNKHLGESEGKE